MSVPFLNRFAVVLDASVLVPALKRDVLLSLAEAGLFRAVWSEKILSECERALREMFIGRGDSDPAGRARQVRSAMEKAFPEAMVEGLEPLIPCPCLPDDNDRHVLAAALRGHASMVVTDNLRDFPAEELARLDLEVRSADDFIADTIEVPSNRDIAIGAIARMRARYHRPQLTAAALLKRMRSNGLAATAEILEPFSERL